MGDNLQDHLFLLPFAFELEKAVSLSVDKLQLLLETLKYVIFGTGIL